MVSVDNLKVEFGVTPLFEDVSYVINKRDRIALVGKNGAGKSTMLKILAGIQAPTSGSVSVPRDVTIGYLPQVMILSDKHTVMEEAEMAFEHIFDLQASIERMNQELADRTDYDSENYHKLIEKFTHDNERFLMMGGTNYTAEIERTLMGLGFNREDFNRPTSEFSGGWRMRIELAKLLLRRPDVLLLDEPTNHLDIESIQWLENFLKTSAGAVVLVSHDRAFINNVTNRTIEISCGHIYDYKVAYDEFVVLRKERREQQLRAYENQQKQIQDTEDFIERFRYKATKAVQVQMEADNHFLLSVLGAILVVIVILLYAFRCTKLVKKSSPIDAIRSGQTGERYKKKSPFRLVKSHGSTGFFMAVNDVFSAPKRYMTIITTFFLCTLFVLVFVNVSSTMRSDTFITTFGTRSDLYYTDLTEAMSCMNPDGRKQIEEYFAKTEALFKKNGMPAKLCVETQYKYKVHFDGKDYSISCQQGIHTKASEYEYTEGVVPQNKNEIAITPTVSKLTGAKLGDTVTIDFGKETLDCVVVAYFQSMNQLGEVIRLHEDAPTDFTYIANVMSYQIDFDDHPSAKEIEIRKEKIKKLFDNEKVMNATEYCDDCMGAASTMESVKYLLLGITLIVVLLVCILMERSFLADEKSQIAVLKAMGFGNKRVMEWHMTRFGIVTLVAVFLAAICSIPATYLIGNPIFGMMGAGKVAYVIRPWKIFFLYPGIIFLMTLLASGMTALQIRTIKSNDTTNIE